MHLEPDRRLLGTVQQNINGIFHRLTEVLPVDDYVELRRFIEHFLGTGVASMACLAALPS